MNEYQKIYDAIIEGDEDKALEEAKTLLAQGVPPIDIINQGLITAMEEIGRLYKEEEIFIPERYCRPAGDFQEVFGADHPPAEPCGPAANHPGGPGRLSADQKTGGVYRPGYPGGDGDGAFRRGLPGKGCRQVPPQRRLHDAACMAGPG